MESRRERAYNAVRDVRIGLEIFERHGGVDVSPEHDVLHAGQKEGEALSAEEIAALYAAGWFIDCDCCPGCADEGDPTAHAQCEGDTRHKATCNHWSILP